MGSTVNHIRINRYGSTLHITLGVVAYALLGEPKQLCINESSMTLSLPTLNTRNARKVSGRQHILVYRPVMWDDNILGCYEYEVVDGTLFLNKKI
jgi:hypothetical protein